MRKMVMFVATALFLFGFCLPTQAKDDWFFRGVGGVLGTRSQIEEGDINGTAQFTFGRVIWKDMIAISGQYWDINNGEHNWEDYTGKLYFFTRSIKSGKPQIYMFTAGGGTHGGESAFADGSFNGGFGFLTPQFWEIQALVEFSGAYLEKGWLYTAMLGVHKSF